MNSRGRFPSRDLAGVPAATPLQAAHLTRLDYGPQIECVSILKL